MTTCLKAQATSASLCAIANADMTRKWNTAMNYTPLFPAQPTSPIANHAGATLTANRMLNAAALRQSSVRMLRLAQVKDITGLGKTKIYELQGAGAFPMRVKITGRSVAWIEDEVQAWLATRIQASTPLQTI
jgi:prophage regulatory protein